MSSKKLVNEPLSCVAESLSGYVMSRDDLQMIEGTAIVVRKDLETLKLQNKVVLITGGGSGHEPAHIGYVGRGMLTAAVCGGVFASPTSSAVLSAILTCATPAGVLLIVKNYTGDRLNFGKALEVAKQRNVNIRMVVVGEDCALVSRDKSAGRRGLCATILVHKMAGEMAEQGKSLDEIFHFVQQASKEMGTISISLSSCSIPGKPANFAIAHDQIEFGLGIHGEAGIERIKMEKATVLVKRMIDHILHSGYMPLLKPGSNVVVVVNNLGSTTDLELYVVAREALQYLKTLEISVDRCYVGTFVTSLDMAGVSISLMMSSGQRLALLDAPTDAPSWSKSKGVINEAPLLSEHPLKENEERVEENTTELGELIKGLCTTCCNKLLENEEQLNMLDRTCGDGDTGTTLASGAKAILSALESRKAPVNSPHKFFNFIGRVIENVVGGSSGALLSLLMLGMAECIEQTHTVKDFSKALLNGINLMKKYGGAEEGDRTMLDALAYVRRCLQSSNEDESLENLLSKMHSAAKEGAESTIKMVARAGRASYVTTSMDQPDPGAWAVQLVFQSMTQHV